MLPRFVVSVLVGLMSVLPAAAGEAAPSPKIDNVLARPLAADRGAFVKAALKAPATGACEALSPDPGFVEEMLVRFGQNGSRSYERRVALVVGNGAYEAIGPLRNPPNDAASMAKMFRALGFTVYRAIDATEKSLDDCFEKFKGDLEASDMAGAKADIALFFYAGHGLQLTSTADNEKRNYMLSVDAGVDAATGKAKGFRQVDKVLTEMRAHSKQAVFLYDACRNAPYEEGTVSQADGQSVRASDASLGAAQIDTEETDRASQAGLFIAYATSPGKTADDAWGPEGSAHSPFTEALLKNLPTPGAILEEALLKAYYSAGELTGWKQTPWTSSSLTAEMKLNGPVRVGDLAIRSAERAARAATSREQGLRGRAVAEAVKAMPRTWIDDERAEAFGAARVEVFQAMAAEEVTLRGHKRGVQAGSFSADGEKIVTAGEDVRIWKAATGSQLAQFTGFGSNPRIAKLSPDGRRLFVDGNFWDVATSKRALSLEDPALHRGYDFFVYSPDGRRAVTSSEKRVPSPEFPRSDTLIKASEVWDTTTGKRLLTLKPQKGYAVGAAFSPDGRRLIEGARRSAAISDARSGDVLGVFAPEADVLAVVYGAEGPRALAGDLSAEPVEIKVFDAATQVALATLKDVQDDELSFTFSDDGRHIAATTNDGVALWDALTGEKLFRRTGHLGSVWGSAFSADGQRILTVSADGTARTWNAAPEHAGPSDGEAVSGAMFSADGARIVSFSREGRIRISDAATGRDVTPRSLAAERASAVDRQLKRIVSVSDGQVKVWDAVSGVQIATLDPALSELDRIALSPDGRRGLSIRESEAFVWSATTGKILATLSGGDAKINYGAFSQSGERIVTPLNDCTSRIWSASTGAELTKLEWTIEDKPGFVSICMPSMWAVFSPDDRLIATLGFGSGTIWNSGTGEEAAKFGPAKEGAGLAVFSPDSERILTDTGANDARLFDTSSGEPLRDFVGHFAEIRSAIFTPDGRRIMTASADATVRFWDAQTGKELDRLVGETAAMSPDGRRFLTAGNSAPMKIRRTGLYGPELLDAAYVLLTDDLRAEVERERIRYWEVDPSLLQ